MPPSGRSPRPRSGPGPSSYARPLPSGRRRSRSPPTGRPSGRARMYRAASRVPRARAPALQYANGLRLGDRRTVGSVGEEGLEPIGDADDADLERDLLGAKRVGVTGAIEPLVVVAYDRQQPREALEPGQDLLAEDGVAFEHRALLRRELARLRQNG